MCKDLCDEERRFSRELRSYFDIEAEDLPPFYVEAVLEPSEGNLVERVIKRTYARLGLQHERVSTQRGRIRRLSEWIKLPPVGFGRYALFAASFLIVLGLVFFASQRPKVYAQEPPRVLRTFPVDGAEHVPADAPIVIFLDRGITPDTRYVVTLTPPQEARISVQGRVMVIESFMVMDPSSTVRTLYPPDTVRVHLVFRTRGGRSSEHSFSFAPVEEKRSAPTIYHGQE